MQAFPPGNYSRVVPQSDSPFSISRIRIAQPSLDTVFPVVARRCLAVIDCGGTRGCLKPVHEINHVFGVQRITDHQVGVVNKLWHASKKKGSSKDCSSVLGIY